MTRKELAQIAVRFLALCLLVKALSYGVQSFYFSIQQLIILLMRNGDWFNGLLGLLGMLPLAGMLLLCWLLWRYANVIADRLTRTCTSPEDAVMIQVNASDLLDVGILLTGTWLWVSFLLGVVPWLASMAFEREMGEQWPQAYRSLNIDRGATLLAQFVVGAILIFKQHGVVHLLMSLRDLGLKKPAS